MEHRTRSLAEGILGSLEPAPFRQLLEAAQAPDDGVSGVALIDLDGPNLATLGDDEFARTCDALARDLLGHGDGTAMEARAAQAPLLGLQLDGHVCLLFPGDELTAVAVQLGRRVDLGVLRALRERLLSALADDGSDGVFAAEAAVRWLWRIDPADGRVRESLPRPGAVSPRLEQAATRPGIGIFFAGILKSDFDPGRRRAELKAALIDDGQQHLELIRIPFLPRLVVVVAGDSVRPGHRIWGNAAAVAEDVLREVISLLLGGGMTTQLEPFPQTEQEFDAIVAELRALPPDDLDSRLDLGGFADHPVQGASEEMRCRECIYYLPHRRWCDLPELPVPVEAHWYCRLWKL